MINLKAKRIFLFIINLLLTGCLPVFIAAGTELVPASDAKHDSIEKQILYNGRAWRNLYSRIKGDQFLFSANLLNGTVTIGPRTFKNLLVKYDIYNDEILTTTDHGIILQLNKEMIDFFSINYDGKSYLFKRLDADSTNTLSGYVNVLYDSNISLYIKYRKEILLLAVENKFDLFNQLHKIYLKKGGVIILVNNRRDFLNQLKDHKQEVRSFIKSNKLKITKKIPESFQPVVEYYDRLQYPKQ